MFLAFVQKRSTHSYKQANNKHDTYKLKWIHVETFQVVVKCPQDNGETSSVQLEVNSHVATLEIKASERRSHLEN